MCQGHYNIDRYKNCSQITLMSFPYKIHKVLQTLRYITIRNRRAFYVKPDSMCKGSSLDDLQGERRSVGLKHDAHRPLKHDFNYFSYFCAINEALIIRLSVSGVKRHLYTQLSSKWQSSPLLRRSQFICIPTSGSLTMLLVTGYRTTFTVINWVFEVFVSCSSYVSLLRSIKASPFQKLGLNTLGTEVYNGQ